MNGPGDLPSFNLERLPDLPEPPDFDEEEIEESIEDIKADFYDKRGTYGE